jgi:hypothetical protein
MGNWWNACRGEITVEVSVELVAVPGGDEYLIWALANIRRKFG